MSRRVLRVRRAVAAVGAAALLASCGPDPASDPGSVAGPGTADGRAVGTGVDHAPPALLGTAADALPAAAVVLVRPDGTEVPVAVRVAATVDARRRGLMGVADLPVGTGMLFRFPDLAAHGGFWMRGTLVPLDVAFLAAGEVTAVATMTPCTADPCPVTRPDGPYDAALEVPAGWLAAEGVGPGTRLVVVAEDPPGGADGGE